MDANERVPFWAKCVRCKHIWTAAYLPMDMTAFANLAKGLCCPMCAATAKEITPAKQDNGKLKERTDHAEI